MTCPVPTTRRGFWFRLTGTLVVAVAIVLPYRMRLLFARVCTFLHNGFGAAFAVGAGRQARFWNHMVLLVVFYLGISSAALFRWIGKLFSTRRKVTGTYWIERETPESFIEKVKEPF